MTISVNWPTKVISVPKADMTLISSDPYDVYELDLDVFRLTLKSLEDDADGMGFPKTHNHNTEVVVAGLTLARVIEIVNGYTVTFEDGQYAVSLVGANSNLADVVNLNQVSIRSANSAGLITVTSGSGLSAEEHDQLMALPDLSEVEASSVLAKQTTVANISGEVATLPTLSEIEASTVLAKEDTVQSISGQVADLPTLSDIENSTVLAKQTELLRALGLMQENYYLDQTTYTTYNGVKLLTGGRLRTYSAAGSVGTDNDVLATYLIAASWSDDQLQSYGVAKQ